MMRLGYALGKQGREVPAHGSPSSRTPAPFAVERAGDELTEMDRRSLLEGHPCGWGELVLATLR